MRTEDSRPRLIVWQLTGDRKTAHVPLGAGIPLFTDKFTMQECMLTIESISRVSRPILVLTGPGVVRFPELFEIVQYGFALGLKVIVEGTPEELSGELLLKYTGFGRRVFRILIDGRVAEGVETRYDETPGFRALEECVARLRKAGYEIHLGMKLGAIEARQLAFIHDYAFRRSADGLYFHLDWTGAAPVVPEAEIEGERSDKIIQSIATIKLSSPRGMLFSPQCIRYSRRDEPEVESGNGPGAASALPVQWCHSCVGGKTYAFITPEGNVQICKNLSAGSDDLRSNGYDFKGIWERSGLLDDLRARSQSCAETRVALSEFEEEAI